MTETPVTPRVSDSNPTNGPHETLAATEARPQDSIASFTTAKGSVYTYDEDGHTTRLKTKTDEEQPKQDITVFIDVDLGDAKTIAAAYLLRSSTEKTRLEVVEQQADGSMRVVSDAQDITNPNALLVATFRGERFIKSKPASLFPQVGLYVFDSRHYEEDDTTKTERHLGHKVTSIQYKD
jgi:hypothetical protein